ncbi:MAG: helix-turn-helix transcriptional regulator [Thermoplasmata archaeon]|nr:MAG: helix-turn-helix transcriptional regulator [Thermoplasmata archaeon]
MDYTQNNQIYQEHSIAHLYRQLDQPIRRKIINILQASGPQSFKMLSETLEMDRAALAYHLRVLKSANLVENYYENQSGSKTYSYYKLSDFSRWLLNHDMNLSLESMKYRPATQEPLSDHSSYGETVRTAPKKALQVSVPQAEDDSELVDQAFEIRKDPRVKYSTYRIKIK